MTRQALGAAIAMGFVAAFIGSVALHSLIAGVIVLLSGVTVAFVLGISWMRTAPSRIRGKPPNSP